MDIKAELRLIRGQCSITWERIVEEKCPNAYDDRLDNPCKIPGDGCKNITCEYCWDKAIEEEMERE